MPRGRDTTLRPRRNPRVSGRPWPDTPTPAAHAEDIARWWSEAAGREVKVTVVYSYLDKSLPADPEHGRYQAGRYADNPVPAPDRYRGYVPEWIWRPELEEEQKQWWRSRPGSGAGGGRPRRGTEEQPVPKPAARQPRTTPPQEGAPDE